MKLLAQHGSKAGTRIIEGLNRGVIDGAVFGAKDIKPDALREKLSEIETTAPGATRLFDPQFYGCFHAAEAGARMGQLLQGEGESQYPYFGSRRRSVLERETNVRADIRACLEFQSALNVSAFIAPNIVIRRALDSIEALIAKSFIRNTAEVWEEMGGQKPVYATLAISMPALLNRTELHTLLSDLTALETPPTGFYLLMENPDGEIPPCLIEPEALANWMLINHSLKINGFQVINGYSDVLSPFLGITGADAGASGWWNTLKSFSLRRFEPSDGGGRFPVVRYTSCALLKSIRHTELDSLRSEVPEMLNGLPSDEWYDPGDGSKPEEHSFEALQNWDAIVELNRRLIRGADIGASLEACETALNTAEQLYASAAESGVTFRDRSNQEHIDAIRDGLNSFRRQAEI